MMVMAHLLPRIGPFKSFGFKVPTPETEKMFEDSFDAAVKRNQASFAEAKVGDLRVANRDLDTGQKVSPGEYALTDVTYDKLTGRNWPPRSASKALHRKLRQNILTFICQHENARSTHGIRAATGKRSKSSVFDVLLEVFRTHFGAINVPHAVRRHAFGNTGSALRIGVRNECRDLTRLDAAGYEIPRDVLPDCSRTRPKLFSSDCQIPNRSRTKCHQR